MLIIVEGSDLTGKTTLCRELMGGLGVGVEYIHASKPERHPVEEYENRVIDYDCSGLDLVIDRWHWGEMVWPAIFGRPTKFDDAMFLHVELLLRSRGAVMVHAQRPTHVLARALELAPSEPVTAAQLPGVIAGFRAVAARSILPIVDYDFDCVSKVDAARALRTLGESYADDVDNVMSITTEWIGSTRPDVLLVGDRFNDGPGALQTAPRVPFAPYRGTSGHFLMTELCTVDLTNVAICNAYRGDGSYERLADLWRALGRPPVVALGRAAQERLIKHKRSPETIPFALIPHPQYSRRFERAKGVGAYGELVRSAAGY